MKRWWKRAGAANRVAGRGAKASFLALLLVSATATAALAHYVYAEAEVWSDATGRCLEVRSEISHGNGGGYSKGTDLTYKELLGQPCIYQWDRGPGYLRVKYNLLKWTGSSWGFCKGINYKYNQTTTNIFNVYTYWGTSPPCGSGTYGTQTYGHVYYNGAWRGGSMWSGSHSLPA